MCHLKEDSLAQWYAVQVRRGSNNYPDGKAINTSSTPHVKKI